MKIVGLSINGLHGYRDLEITFDSNLTFLYRTNGYRKTTVLDILGSIMSGSV